jgi:hypothetical protein
MMAVFKRIDNGVIIRDGNTEQKVFLEGRKLYTVTYVSGKKVAESYVVLDPAVALSIKERMRMTKRPEDVLQLFQSVLRSM